MRRRSLSDGRASVGRADHVDEPDVRALEDVGGELPRDVVRLFGGGGRSGRR